MGIRYYAYPLAATDVPPAQIAPMAFIPDDPLMDAWAVAEDRPDMLYLDKRWFEFQELFRANSRVRAARPAAMLVAGRVIETFEGWAPVVQVLDPDQVAFVALDLATVTAKEVMALARNTTRFGASADETFAEMTDRLEDAGQFVEKRVANGEGLIYLIG